MKDRSVLIVGTAGFIGEAALTEIRRRGHPVTALVRRPDGLERRHPGTTIRTVQLADLVTPAAWAEYVAGQDAVLYAAGLLRARDGGDPETLHHRVPLALAEAADKADVRRLVHLSVLGTDAPTRFAQSRVEADRALSARSKPATLVVRASLLIGRGASGGTALLRALAAVGWRTPLIDGGRQPFQPLPLEHLAAFLADALAAEEPTGIIEAVGPETLELREILALYRAWLGLAPLQTLSVPSRLARPICLLGDIMRLDPLTSAALDQLAHGSAGAHQEPYAAVAATPPPRLADWFAANPSTPQDRADAATWLLRPALRLAFAAFWLASGTVGLVAELGHGALGSVWTGDAARILWTLAFALGVVLGAALVFARDQKPVAYAQLVLILCWTLLIGLTVPGWWQHPFALLPLPLFMAALVHLRWTRGQ